MPEAPIQPARPPSRAVSAVAHASLGALALAGPAALFLFGFKQLTDLVGHAWSAACPSDAFVANGASSAIVYLGGVALPFALAVCVAVDIFRAGRLLLLRVGLVAPARAPASGRRRWRVFDAVTVGLVLLLAADTLFEMRDVNCLTPGAVFVRKAPWAPLAGYGWDEVRAVTTRCNWQPPTRRGLRGHWSGGVTLEMKDGTIIPVGGAIIGDGGEDPRYGALATALRGRSVRFDVSDVESGCSVVDVQRLTRP